MSNRSPRRLRIPRVPIAVYILIGCFVVAAIRYDSFLTFLNITNVLRQCSMLALAGIGMTLCIVSGTIDLSLGMMLGLAGVIAIKCGENLMLTLLLTVGIFAVLGLLKGLIITKLNLAPMITTLSFMFMTRGLILIINGRSAVQLPKSATALSYIGRGYIGSVPFPVILLIVFAVLFMVVMRHTALGRHMYAAGGSADSARMMGIRVARTQVMAQVLCSVLVGIAGLMMTARLGALTPLQGEGFESKAITAAVLGGASLSGGVGGVIGTVIGALLLSIISNMFNLQGNIPSAWQNIISGILLIVIVVAQSGPLKKMMEPLFGRSRILSSSSRR